MRQGARHISGRWTRRAHDALARFVVLVPFAVHPAAIRAQTVHYGVVMDRPRILLDSLWTDDPRQSERAYCVSDFSAFAYHDSGSSAANEDSVFRVFAVQAADTRGADPNSVDFECPHGDPELHTHTPSTCTGDDPQTCVAGGLNAFSCQPSRRDLEKLVHRHDPFAVIQCDRRAFRFYYPSEYVPAPASSSLAAVPSAKPMESGIPPVLRPPRKSQP